MAEHQGGCLCGAVRYGTKLWLGLERFPDVVGVYGGTLDNPDWFPRDPANTKHIYLNVAQHGTVIPAGLDTFAEHAPAKDGSAVDPDVSDAPRVICGGRQAGIEALVGSTPAIIGSPNTEPKKLAEF